MMLFYGFFLFLFGGFQSNPNQNSKLDSLRLLIQQSPIDDSAKVMRMYELGYNQALQQLPEAKETFQKTYDLGVKIDFLKQNPAALHEIAKIYDSSGDQENATTYFLKAVREAIHMNQPLIEAQIYTNMAGMYKRLNSMEIALEYYRKSLAIKKIHGSARDQAITIINMGNLYRQMGNIPEAKASFEASKIAFEEANDLRGIALSANNLGNIFSDERDLVRAEQNYRKANEMFKKMNFKPGFYGTMLNIGAVLSEQGKRAEAATLLTEALEGGTSISDFDIVIEAHQSLSQVYEATRQFEKANVHLKAFTALKDSIAEAKNRGNIEKLRIEFETEKKEKENEILRQEAIARQAKMTITLFAAIVIGALSFVLLFLYRKQIKTSSLLRNLSHQILGLNDEIQHQKEALRTQNEELRQTNLTKDRLFSILAHDVRSPFAGLLGFAELLYTQADQLSADEVRDYGGRVLKNARAVNALLENLLHWSRLELGQVKPTPTTILLHKSVATSVELFSLNAERKNIQISVQIPTDLTIETDEVIFSTIVRNLISNAIKYSHAGSVISIHCATENGFLKLMVEDHGVGIPPELLADLFSLEAHESRPGTNYEKGTGLGLHVCKRLSEKIGGQIGISSKEGEGTTVSLELAA